MRWFGLLAGLVLVVALVGGVGALAYQAGLQANAVTQVVQAAPAGAEGGAVIVRGMHPGYGYGGYGYGYGHPFGFLHFLFFILLLEFVFKVFAFGSGGRHHGGWRGGPGGWEQEARRRHDEWHGRTETGSGSGSEPPSTGATT